MKKFVKLCAILLCLVMMFTLFAACGNGEETPADTSKPADASKPAETIVLKLTHSHAEESQYQAASLAFKEYVEEKSGGAIQIDVYPNSTLGEEVESIDGLLLGTIDLAIVSPGNLADRAPLLACLNLPYLFESQEHADAVMFGEIGREILDQGEADTGLIMYTYGQVGFRNTMNNVRSLYTPADLEGIKLRVPNIASYVNLFERLGAVPLTTAFNEVYTGVSAGMMDGLENPTSVLVSDNFFEVCKYLTLTEHVYDPCIYVGSGYLKDKLTEEQQQILADGFDVASEVSFEYVAEAQTEYISIMEENGVTVNEVTDKGEWAAIAAPIYDDFADTVPPELIARIKAANPA